MLETMTVGQLVVERPARARVFERHGIDYCCGGKVPLRQACATRNVPLDTVLRDLLDQDTATPAAERDWSTASLAELANHIETTHHAYLKAELPRLDHLTARVAEVHGSRHPELVAVRSIFQAFESELEQHMLKEERILFPMCRELDRAQDAPSFHCGSVGNPIRVMMMEHDHAGDALAQMRQLTNDYNAPADACNSYRAMLAGLSALEADMHQHVHKENNILFPRAVAREEGLQ